ncbi:uncharacterized protein LOC121741038 [Salvia splendens]|uniref:uncharacterized protein LOC121741038 n=1 Tax=Salvia splendens TaxID=180675 RepID=UPI001C273F0C|nr:uncharacterized protein LOC121741038 [Salvia splendens]XP_041989656.1 uncharacterized protein LOC121741038 [Salvia splendens]
MKEIQQALKQQHADYLHNRDIVMEDELEDEEYVTETPEHSTEEQHGKELEEGTSGVLKSIRVLPAFNAWLRRGAEFDLDPRYHKRELELIKFDILEKDRIVLDEQDIIPVPRGWGACLLGRFTGRFPGKEAIQGLMRRWPCKSRVIHHSKGWLIFQFGSDDDRETVRQNGPFEIFGIPLVLQPMPEDFDLNMDPEVNVPLWIRLVDLPLTLWNLTAISKIASCLRTPLSTDFNTLRRESLDGPQVQVIINTAVRPKTNITVQLPNWPYEQKVVFEFFPGFCNACKAYGHFADECCGRKAVYEQHVQYGAGSRAQSKDRARSKSRPHEQYSGKAFNKEWPRLGGNQGEKNTKGVL